MPCLVSLNASLPADLNMVPSSCGPTTMDGPRESSVPTGTYATWLRAGLRKLRLSPALYSFIPWPVATSSFPCSVRRLVKSHLAGFPACQLCLFHRRPLGRAIDQPMNVPVSLATVALSLFLASAAKAQAYDGTVTFSGAVVVPTCLTTEKVVTGMATRIVSASDGEEGVESCLMNPGGKHPQIVPFKSRVRLLGPDETDRLLRYFVQGRRTSGDGGSAGSKLITVTYL